MILLSALVSAALTPEQGRPMMGPSGRATMASPEAMLLMQHEYYRDRNIASSSAAGSSSSMARPVDEEKFKDEDEAEAEGEAEPPTAGLSEAQKRKRRRVALQAKLAEAPSCNAMVTI